MRTHHTLAAADNHIDGIDLVRLEVALLVLLTLRLARVLYDRLLAIDLELLQLVAEHALDRLALVRLADLLHGIGD